jgi:Tat protein secretion system quality control protein TatD with DNase activity
VVETARVLAGVKQVDEAALADATRANALRLFAKMAPTRERGA